MVDLEVLGRVESTTFQRAEQEVGPGASAAYIMMAQKSSEFLSVFPVVKEAIPTSPLRQRLDQGLPVTLSVLAQATVLLEHEDRIIVRLLVVLASFRKGDT